MSDLNKQPLSIAFVVNGGSGWIAGLHYFQNLFAAIRATSSDVELFVLPGEGTTDSDLTCLQPFNIKILRLPPEPTTPAAANANKKPGLLARLFGKTKAQTEDYNASAIGASPTPSKEQRLGKYLQENGVDCIFGIGEFGPDFPVPQISWIYDFQHKELPQMFSGAEIESRDYGFGRMMQYADRVVLSSEHAASVARRYYPDSQSKLSVMPFVAQIPAAAFQVDLADLLQRYNLPEKFLFLPNQFWKHKNHGVMIEALSIAVQAEPELTIVCSGATVDYRDPEYMPSLQARIAELNLVDRIKILGLIPENDVFALMRQSVCLVQPSLYEGWSTVVEQAKSLGKAIILSNLAVHIEQNPPGAAYFDPHKAPQLAELILERYRHGKAGPDSELEKQAAQLHQQHSAKYGKRFLAIAAEVKAKRQPVLSAI